MATLTAVDLKKTIPEYLGVTGTPTEVALRLEQDKRVSDLLDSLLSDTDTSYRKDSNGLTYAYLIDRLCAASAALSLADIKRDRDVLIQDFRREYDEIQSDYTEKGGDKAYLLLKALNYDSDKDGFDRKSFFFRFWRSPVEKVLTYRGVTVGTPEGDDQAKKILRELFSVHLEEAIWRALLNETPEHLVEQRAAIEEKQKAEATEHKEDMARLKHMTFSEIWTYKGGYYWSPNVAVDLSGLSAGDTNAYLSMLPQTRAFLLKFIRNPRRDQRQPAGVPNWEPEEEPLDPEFFQAISSLTIAQVKENQNRLISDLKARNDWRFLNVNPDISFQDYAQNRFYSAVLGKSDERAALQTLLQTQKIPVDTRAVKAVRDKKCSEILSDRNRIVNGILTRRGLRWGTWLSSATLSGMLLFGFLTGQKTESKPEPAPKKAPVQLVSKPTKKTPVQKSVSVTTQTAPKSTVSEKPQKTAQQATGDKEVHIQLRPLVLPNRPIYLEWQTFRDQGLKKPDETLSSQFLTGLYRSVLNRIETSGRTCAEFLDSIVVAQSMRIGSNTVFSVGPLGHESPKFYFNPKQRINGQDAKSAIVQDLINYGRNLGEVLTDLPVDPAHKAEVQALALKAIGPGIGWSQDQQQMYQAYHPKETRQAYQSISTLTHQIMTEQKIGLNDPEGITLAVLTATARYRQDHPDYQAYSLIALDTAREISNGRDNLRVQNRANQGR